MIYRNFWVLQCVVQRREILEFWHVDSIVGSHPNFASFFVSGASCQSESAFMS